MKGLALLLSILTFAAFGAAIYLSRDQRWVTVLFSGIGLIAAGFAVIVARHVAGGIVVGQLVANDSVKPAAEATWTIATSLMTSIATTVIVVGVLFAAAGWLGSPTGSARASRRALAPVLRDYPAYVYTGLAIVVCIYFLSAPTQGLRSFLTTLIVAAMAAFGIRELRKQTATEFPDAHFTRCSAAPKTAWSTPSKAPTSASERRNCACRRCAGRAARPPSPKRQPPPPRQARTTPASLASSAWPACTRRASSPTRSSPPRSPASCGNGSAGS